MGYVSDKEKLAEFIQPIEPLKKFWSEVEHGILISIKPYGGEIINVKMNKQTGVRMVV